MARPVLVLIAMVCAVMVLMQTVQGQEQCGPGGNGNKCGSGNCCSKYGYCGSSNDYCGSGCQKGYGKCNGGSCFPASATVMTRGGINKPISELAIGEEVAVWNENGELEYDDVYAHGHLDDHTFSVFVVLTISSLENENVTKTIELTPGHFTILEGKNTIEYKRAEDVRVGDKMLATNDHLQFSSFVVSDVKTQVFKGLYNPFTLRGTIVVNDVLASCHSDWFLDSTFDRLDVPHLLPSVYQAILAPVRMLYRGIGKDAYTSLYSRLDSHFDIAKSASDFNGYFKLLAMTLSQNSHAPKTA